jgi:beta-lactamase regulating signal transducer with metallopeptidase domain
MTGMSSTLALRAASEVVSFLLKTTFEWCVCLLLVRAASSARSRFNLWLTMLLAFGAQWGWMWAAILRRVEPTTQQVARVAAHGGLITVPAGVVDAVGLDTTILLAGYLLVTAWGLLGTVAARIRLARAMRHKVPAGERVEAIFRDVINGAGPKLRRCELWVLPGLGSPATLGWFKPKVIVPPPCEAQDEAELRAAFWHELKHVQRRDALWNGVVRVCRDVLWFHPCARHAAAALCAERELACDAAVVREHPLSRDVYATCLVRFARMRDLAPEPAAATIEMASSDALLTTRVQSILNDLPGAGRFSRAWRGAASAALIGLMAATVPGVNVLFGAARVGALVESASQPAAKGEAKRHLGKAAGVVLKQADARVGGFEMTGAEPAAVTHDEALAAEHRAAMGVLTESTGMDGEDEVGRTTNAGATGGSGHPGARKSPTGWTAVAVDAAERIALAGGGHDSDDHH